MDKYIETIEDYYRLSYHITPPTGLLNDPNGFIEYGGRYHIFYQWNPYECAHGKKSWGHLSSVDLVHWTKHKPALKPTDTFDKDGCYSGSSVEDNGDLFLIYTGNVKYKDGNRDSYQCLAKSSDGINFEKLGPVIDGPPSNFTKHFRDPKVWKKEETWYMVIGGQGKDLQGKVLLYSSLDLFTWNYIGIIAGSMEGNTNEFGYMWECPDLFTLGSKDILIVSPQGIEPLGDKYNNIYQSGYLIGSMDYNKGVFSHGAFNELDRGFEFYAPQTTLDSQGRRLLFGWMGLPEREKHPTTKNGWIHGLTLPRELYLLGDKLCQRPVEELKKLRKKEISYEDIVVDKDLTLDGVEGDSYELIANIDNIDCNIVGVALRVGRGEETLFYLDREIKKLILNRDKSGKGGRGIRRCEFKESRGLKLHIFVDRSSVEIFVDEGVEVFTSRIYPSIDSTGIRFFSDRKYTLKKLTLYKI